MNIFFNPQSKEPEESFFGKWYVSKCGDMCYDGGKYNIYDNQLKNEDWIAHMFSKGWIDWNEFIPAYFQALKNAKIKTINMLVFYPPRFTKPQNPTL